ncbi:MAG: hypothetical protein J7L82_01140, partial [Staphylothermus sp.]|nr:hypothetical protein [Staphylothermus sp.]
YTTMLLIPMIYNTLQYNKRARKTTKNRIENKPSTMNIGGILTNRKNNVKVVILLNDFDEKQLNKFISLLASKTFSKDEREAEN